MVSITIKRVCSNLNGTFGVIMNNDTPFAVTLERQWLDNQTGISCIPAGSYTCKRVRSPRFGNTFEITNVPNRSHILFHKGNLDDNSKGCILLGEQFGELGGSAGILSSKHGYNEYMKLLEGEDEHKLLIINCFEGGRL